MFEAIYVGKEKCPKKSPRRFPGKFLAKMRAKMLIGSIIQKNNTSQNPDEFPRRILEVMLFS